jgi:DNA-binding transcriptional ArsR family regulator
VEEMLRSENLSRGPKNGLTAPRREWGISDKSFVLLASPTGLGPVLRRERPYQLAALFPTVRADVLSATLLQPDHWRFMTELARHLEVTPSSLQRELASLVASGFLLRRQDGRRIYFKANTESPVFPELRGLVEKTVGIVPELNAAN